VVQRLSLYLKVSLGGPVYLLFGDRMDIRVRRDPNATPLMSSGRNTSHSNGHALQHAELARVTSLLACPPVQQVRSPDRITRLSLASASTVYIAPKEVAEVFPTPESVYGPASVAIARHENPLPLRNPSRASMTMGMGERT
jgi:hypothetical protein